MWTEAEQRILPKPNLPMVMGHGDVIVINGHDAVVVLWWLTIENSNVRAYGCHVVHVEWWMINDNSKNTMYTGFKLVDGGERMVIDS